MPQQERQPPPDPQRDGQPPDQPRSRPWRTEGLPKKQPAGKRPRWAIWAAWGLGYLLLFGLMTVQDRSSGPLAIPYTQFKTQVTNKNVAEVFARGDTIQGALKKAVPVPGQPEQTY